MTAARRRLLLTGAGGFIGAHTLRHFLTETDWDIVATDSFRHKGKTDRILQTVAGGPDDWRKRTTVITHDLTAPLSWQTEQQIGAVDYVIAMASQSHVDRSIEDPAAFIRNNTEVMLNTLGYCHWGWQDEPEHIIIISTDEVYGPVERGSAGHPEWAPVIPSNPYSASKACQEAIATSYWRTYGLPVTIVNCMNAVGEMQDSEKFLPMLIKRISRGEVVPIHGTPGNVGSRHYIHARNIADALLYILRELPPAKFPAADRPDRYNVAGLETTDNLELAQMVAGIVGKPLKYELVDFHSARPGHDPHYGLDVSRLSALGWKAPVDFRESLERTVRWTLQHEEWLA